MFEKTLKENRHKAGMGLREFAGRIGISPGYLSDLENEKVAHSSQDLVWLK
jgi:transcriptional regulator with XRE-family HTH domain